MYLSILKRELVFPTKVDFKDKKRRFNTVQHNKANSLFYITIIYTYLETAHLLLKICSLISIVYNLVEVTY